MTSALLTTTTTPAAVPFQEIPLGKLSVWPGNVRRTGAETGLDELAASIRAHGLLNPLTVRATAKGRYEIVAGQRRFLALGRLVADGSLTRKAAIPCTVIEAERDAGELSLAENVVRLAMHPADQFTAWQGLAAQGASADEIAARFGVTAQTVRRRMALGRVSPRILAAYRDGDLTLEALQVFTLSDDHVRQEAVWDGLDGWQRSDPHSLRRTLTAAEPPTNDKRVRFVGLDAYEAAGGAVRRDLFATDGGGTVLDEVLLDRLVREKLDSVAAEVKAEGWLWTEIRPAFGWDDRQGFVAADATYDEDQPDEDGEPREVWPDEVRAIAGAVVTLGYGGAVQVERGLIRPDDLPDSGDDDGETPSGDEPTAQPDGTPALSASLIEDLTAHRTAALRAELAQSPGVALALVVHTLAAPIFAHGHGRVLKLAMQSRRLPMLDAETTALRDLDTVRERWADRLPGDEAALWEWCLAASQADLLDLLAVVAAHGLDAVVTKADPNRGGQAQGAVLGQALKLDMAQWWTPTALGYFGRVPKAVILADLETARQAPPAPAWAKLPKKELAALAEREVAGTGWLPEPLS